MAIPPPRDLIRVAFEGTLADVTKVLEQILSNLTATGKVAIPPPYGRKDGGVDLPPEVRCEIKLEYNHENRLVFHIHVEQASPTQW